MDIEEIKRTFDKALSEFLAADHDLIELDASERAITHKLAEHLQVQFSQPWKVDCEYNRFGLEPQRKVIHASREKVQELVERGYTQPNVELIEIVTSEDATTVFPDIIVHKRGKQENLLVVEVKKHNNREIYSGWDKCKLRFYVDKLQYTAGVFLIFNTGIISDQMEDLVNDLVWIF